MRRRFDSSCFRPGQKLCPPSIMVFKAITSENTSSPTKYRSVDFLSNAREGNWIPVMGNPVWGPVPPVFISPVDRKKWLAKRSVLARSILRDVIEAHYQELGSNCAEEPHDDIVFAFADSCLNKLQPNCEFRGTHVLNWLYRHGWFPFSGAEVQNEPAALAA